MKNAGSRVFYGLMVFPCVMLCIISVISFSTFAYEHNRVKSDVKKADERLGIPRRDYCILYAESLGDIDHDKKDEIELGNDGPCAFAIWGEVTVCFVSILLGTLYVVKALIGINALSFLALLESVFVILAALLNFVVAIVITAGLDKTCNSFGTTQASCERAVLVIDDKDHVQYYPNINTSKATSWIGTAILIIMAILQLILACAYIKNKGAPRQPPSYEHMENEKEEQSSEKPVEV